MRLSNKPRKRAAFVLGPHGVTERRRAPAIGRTCGTCINHDFLLDNQKIALYSYAQFGHIAGLWCSSPVERFNQEDGLLDRRQPRIGGIHMRKIHFMGLGFVILTLVALFCSANPAWGQEVTASITGTVSDPTGGAIAGATVTAKSVERGLTYTSVTNDSGIYRIPQLP